MENCSTALPIILFCLQILQKNQWTEQYLQGPCKKVKVAVPLTLLMTLLVIHFSGCAYLAYYQRYYQECLALISGNFTILGVAKLHSILNLVPGTMLTWSLMCLQRRLVQEHAPELLPSRYGDVLDVDGMALVSYTRHREGACFGHSKKFSGRPLLQSSASFIGRIFVDFKLFPGDTNTATFFKKAVKRALSLGYHFFVVRADALYGKAENLLFLEQLSLFYAIGIAIKVKALKAAVKEFYHLARKHSGRIINIGKGVDILDLGLVNVAANTDKEQVLRRVILCRRIHRHKNKKGRWKYKFYYYAIVTNLDWTPRQVFKFYHQRQSIENGFKELRYHYSVNTLVKSGKPSLKANEFWIASKIFAMTMYKIFGCRMLSKRLRYKRRTTLLREIFATTIARVENGIVVLCRKPKHLWHIQRIWGKLLQDDFLVKPFVIKAYKSRV